jgi:hypothetical protein
MWTAVFKAGTHTDSNGNTRRWSEKDLDTIVSNYDAEKHEAPVVLGHPAENAPAWGWVEGLKRTGEVLYAKLKLVPEFMELLKKGLFKKRSISLYPDLNLRHVGFLGAMPPAVKGLPDLSFKEGDFISFDLSDSILDSNGKRKEVHLLKSFIEKLKKLLREEFGEELPESVREKEKGLAEKEAQLKRKEISAFCEALLKEGRVTPAMMKAGLANFLEVVSNIEGTYEFAEEGGSEKPADFIRRFLEALPAAVPFGVHAAFAEEAPERKRQKLMEDYTREHEGATYRDAFIALSREHPELFR